MQIQAAHPPRAGGHPAAGVISGGLAVLTGGGLAATDVEIGVAIACVGLLVAVWHVCALEDERTLSRLDAVALGDMAAPLPTLPPVSAHPHRDVAWLPNDLPAVVALPSGGWGLVPHDTATAALGRAGFAGRWHRIARPVEVLDPGLPVPAIGRIPRDADAVLVDTGDAAPHGVTGAAIRTRATAAAQVSR